MPASAPLLLSPEIKSIVSRCGGGKRRRRKSELLVIVVEARLESGAVGKGSAGSAVRYDSAHRRELRARDIGIKL